MSTPAGNSGRDTTTPTAAALAELPAKIRIHALAKLLGRSSREVLAAVTKLGADGRSVQSSIDRELALRVAEALGVTAEPAEPEEPEPQTARKTPPTPVFASASPLFLPPEPTAAAAAPTRPPKPVQEEPDSADGDDTADADDTDDSSDAADADEGRPRRRRGRRGRGRGKGGHGADDGDDEDEQPAKPERASDKSEKSDKSDTAADEQDGADGGEDAATRRRRRRRRRKGGSDDSADGNAPEDDPPNTVVHVREGRDKDSDKGSDKGSDKSDSDGRDEVRSVRGSTRLEAKRQRRRDGREAGRRRAPILSEAEFLARREAVDRAMVIRERGDRIQIGVLEDGVLVEHFVTTAGSGSLVGNVYLGRVQNVLPSMEAAFVDIGRGRNAVLYAGEVDWDAAGLEGKARKIEQALSTGDSVLVQVTKDPVGHKGARLTTQISLPGRFLVYVPGGGATGISRKLPENERRRLKDVLKRVVPEDAGVIIRTASEGISEDELARDVRRLQAQWQVIKDKTEGTNGVRRVNAPALVYEEPDLLVKVVRDLFTEDFSALVIEGTTAWDTVDAYVRHVAPELADRLRKHVGNTDVFAEYRIEEQLLKALDRKVWLPSGGYLVIDRTEAMTVIDVNTGKFTGSGGNLEETVTRNNLESAEEIVRQLRLRDIGGIIVIDFIDMVLESNRDLVLRRLTECLGRDRTRHQVAEVTSLGLVQMTRKRVGTGLLEAFGTTCEHCKGRGVLVSTEPATKPAGTNGQAASQGGGGRRSRGRGGDDGGSKNKDSAREAAAQAAKEAVRDIAKATRTAGPPDPAPADAESSRTPAATGPAALATIETDGATEAPAWPRDAAQPDAEARQAPQPAADGADRGHRAAKADGTDRADRGHRAAKADRTDRADRGDRAAKADGTDRADRGDHAEEPQPESTRPAVAGPEEPGSETAGPTMAEPTAAGPLGAGLAAASSAVSGSGAGPAVEPATGSDGPAAGLSEPAPERAARPADSEAVAPAGSVAGFAESAAEHAAGSAESAYSAAGSAEPAADSAAGSAGSAGSAEPVAESAERGAKRVAERPAGPPEPATDEPVTEPAAVEPAAEPAEPVVPATVTPPRRPVRRAASRPAGPPVPASTTGEHDA